MAASRRPVSDIVRRGAVPSAIANAARRRPALFGALVSLAFAMLAALVCWAVVRVSTGLGFVAVRAAAACLACSFTACLTVAAVCLAAMRSRSRRVASLAERLDAILRDPSCTQSFSDYEEGELAVLANELQKMTVRLRDQADELRRERDSLADSLADISHQLRRREVGIVYQFFNLVPVLDVVENIALPVLLDGRKPDPFAIAGLVATWASPATSTACPTSSRAASSSGRASGAPWRTALRSCWPTSPPATSTPRTRPRSWRSCASRTASAARRS